MFSKWVRALHGWGAAQKCPREFFKREHGDLIVIPENA